MIPEKVLLWYNIHGSSVHIDIEVLILARKYGKSIGGSKI